MGPIEIPGDLVAWLDRQAVIRGLDIATVMLGILYDAKNADEAGRAEAARINRPSDIWSGLEAEVREQRRT